MDHSTPCRATLDLQEHILGEHVSEPTDNDINQLIDEELQRLCADPDLVAEAIGPDGFKGSKDDWNQLMKTLGSMIYEVETARTGLIITSQARTYLRDIAEKHVMDSQ